MQGCPPSPSSKRDISLVISPCSSALASIPLLRAHTQAAERLRMAQQLKRGKGRSICVEWRVSLALPACAAEALRYYVGMACC